MSAMHRSFENAVDETSRRMDRIARLGGVAVLAGAVAAAWWFSAR